MFMDLKDSTSSKYQSSPTIYRFNIIPIKMHLEVERSRWVKTLWKTKVETLVPHDFTIYYKAKVIKTGCYYSKGQTCASVEQNKAQKHPHVHMIKWFSTGCQANLPRIGSLI